MNKKAQQEMIGFVLIVVIVVIGIMIFLVLSIKRTEPLDTESIIATNMLQSIMNYKTDCAIEPEDYDSMEDLIKSCYNDARCVNLGEYACDVLDRTLRNIMENISMAESKWDRYNLTIYPRNAGSEDIMFNDKSSTLNGSMVSDRDSIITGSGNINVKLSLYSD